MVLSFKICSPELKNKILRNVSNRAAEQLQDDLEALGKIKRSDIEQAHKTIIELAKQLESEGTISLSMQSSDEEYI
jgi:flagellar motor switch protein FliG